MSPISHFRSPFTPQNHSKFSTPGISIDKNEQLQKEIASTYLLLSQLARALAFTQLTESSQEKSTENCFSTQFQKNLEHIQSFQSTPSLQELITHANSQLLIEHDTYITKLENIIHRIVDDYSAHSVSQQENSLSNKLTKLQQETLDSITNFIQTKKASRYPERVINDLYLAHGICFGGVVDYTIQKLDDKETESITPTSRARFIQALYNHELFHISNSFRELEYKLKNPSTLYPAFQDIKKCNALLRKCNKEKDFAHIPQSIRLRNNLKITHYSKWIPEIHETRHDRFLSIDQFCKKLTIVLSGLNSEDSPHFYLSLKNLTNGLSEPQDVQFIPTSTSTATELTHRIIGTGAPKKVEERVTAKIVTEMNTSRSSQRTNNVIKQCGHALYLSLKPPYQIKDINYPENNALTTNDKHLFQIYLIMWLALNPYQEIAGLWQISK